VTANLDVFKAIDTSSECYSNSNGTYSNSERRMREKKGEKETRVQAEHVAESQKRWADVMVWEKQVSED
jgi:hypothetical protein